MKRTPRILAGLLLLTLAWSPASMVGAAQISKTAAIERLLTADAISEDWFTPSFLSQVSTAQIDEITADLSKRFGPLVEIVDHGDHVTVHLETADVPVRIALDQDGRITGLFMEPPVLTGGLDASVTAIADLPGEISLLVTTNGEQRVAIRSDEPMAVGSAAKLAVIAALDAAVKEDRLDWGEVVSLRPEWRSLPSGILQNWPLETPITIATLANLTISISDNTATDALIDIVGRQAIETLTPRNTPFLSTRQLFTLKATGNAGLKQAWLDATPQGRRDLAAEIDALPLPNATDLDPNVTSNVEWFLSADELCALLDSTAGLEAVSINAGLANSADWTRVTYKGGSETGVLNLSTRLVDTNGNIHCVVVTWNNDKVLDDNALFGPYRGILRALRPRD